MQAAILALLNVVLPEVIATVKEKFAKQNPDEPLPTDADIHAAVVSWLASTVAKDDSIIG